MTKTLKYFLIGMTFYFCHFTFCFAQSAKIDSLLTLIKTDKEDTSKVNHLHKLCIEYQNVGDFISALTDEQQTLSLSQKLKWGKGESKAYNSIGVIYYNQGDYPKALDNYFKALKIAEEIKEKRVVSSIFGSIGSVYKEQTDYPKALNYYFRAIVIDKEIGNKNGVSRHLGNIGIVYKELGNLPKALDYYLQVLKIAEELKDKNLIAIQFGNIGNVYNDQKEYNKAMDYYLKALQISDELKDKNGIARHHGNIGALYIKQQKYKDAYDHLYQALGISTSIGAMNSVKYRYAELSTLYEKSTTPLPDTIGGQLLNKEEMRLRALYYYKSYMNIRDTLFSQENKKQLVRKEMNFDFEKKKAATKADQDKKDAISKEELKQKEQERNYFIIGFVLVILLALFIFRGFKQKQKANKIITEQKHLVEEKQSEIIASIRYAKRIQQSLLPTEKYIERTFKRLRKN